MARDPSVDASQPRQPRRSRVRRAAVVLTAVAVIVTLAGLAVATRHTSRRRDRGAVRPTTSTSTATTSQPAVSTIPPTGVASSTSPPTTCCSVRTVPATLPPTLPTVENPVAPIARPQDFTGSLDIGTQGQAVPVVERVGGDVPIVLLVRNGSDHSFVIRDPTGRQSTASVALVCSHLGGLTNWSLPVAGAGTRWDPGNNTGITSHEVVKPSDIGRQTCQIAFVRGGSAPRFDPISNGMVSHDVTILATLPNIPAVHLSVVPTSGESTTTAAP